MKKNCSCKDNAVSGKKERNKLVFKSLFLTLICLTVIQCLFLGIKQIVFNYTEETLVSRSMVTMVVMLVLLIFIILYCQHKGYGFLLFPKTFNSLYIVVTLIVVVFYLVTLFIVQPFTIQNALLLFYGSIVTPVFEEILFRGVIWNRLNKCFPKEWETYLVVTIIFALWHIGYAIGIYLWNGGNLVNCIVMKVIIGALFGLITGAVRWKTKNCYGGILIHGVLNALG